MKITTLLTCFLYILAPSSSFAAPSFKENVVLKGNEQHRDLNLILNELYYPGYRHKPLRQMVIGISGPWTTDRDKKWYKDQTESMVNLFEENSIKSINIWSDNLQYSTNNAIRQKLEDFDGMLSIQIMPTDDPKGNKSRPSACNYLQSVNDGNALLPNDYFYIQLYSRFPGEYLWIAHGCSLSEAKHNFSTEERMDKLKKLILQKLIDEKLALPS